MPTVTVFVMPTTPEEMAGMMDSVRRQTFDDWEGVVVGVMRGMGGPDDGAGVGVGGGRWHWAEGSGSAWERLNRELDECRSEFVLILEEGARLRPSALGVMVAAAMKRGEEAQGEGVCGGHRFVAPVGEIPMEESEGAEELDEGAWAERKAAPLGALLLRREMIGGERFDESLKDAAGWEWCLRLASGGARWGRCDEVVVDVALRALPGAEEVLASIQRHARVTAGVGANVMAASGAFGGGGAACDEMAERGGLREAERRTRELIALTSSKGVLMNAGRATPWRYAQWWYRLGFVGRGPSHLLSERSGPAPERLVVLRERRPVDIFLASYQRPERLTAMIESVRGTGYPARVCVAAGDIETVRMCERYVGLVECVYSTTANRRTGCTAALNHVVRTMVRNDAIFCTDDCMFAPDAIDVAMGSLEAAYPGGDGVVGLAQENIPDGYQLAFPLIGKRFLERFTSRGDLFFPGFYHMYNDAELGASIRCLGRWHFEPRANIRHFHPCTGAVEDATHRRGRTHIGADVELWHERRMRGVVWGVD